MCGRRLADDLQVIYSTFILQIFNEHLYVCAKYKGYKMNRTEKILGLVDPTLRSLQVIKYTYCEF